MKKKSESLQSLKIGFMGGVEMAHTRGLGLKGLGGVNALGGGPRVEEKHCGVGGEVRICNNLSASCFLMFFTSTEIGVFSASSFLLHKCKLMLPI